MNRSCTFVLICLCATLASAQEPFLPSAQWIAIRNESSGAVPYENLRYLTTLHRVPATADFDKAAEFMLERAKEYGLADAHSEQFPIDGTRTYGLMRSYFSWNVEEGRLWETKPQHALIADWATDPIRLADYSRSADVESALVDVGNGGNQADYNGKDVRGKIVLADGVVAEVQRLAITEHGAAGIVSDMPNQSTAWSGLDRTLVRWGHMNARQPSGFAFMVSRETADGFRARLKAGEQITLHAQVKATVGPGHWTVVSGTIPGTDPKAGEIVYSCHLDHERPGANDNGSGCVTIMESARILAHLISTGAVPKPLRTLRFIWGPEVEGTMAYLASHPEVKKELRADIHMDMVGGDPFKNKSIFHVTETPWSLPNFVTDVGAAFLDVIKAGASNYAASGVDKEAAVIEGRNGVPGTRNEFIADVTPYSSGSDHDDYDSSTVAVPSLYFRDWPDIYIHTDHDTLQQIDPTKLRRVALLGAASGYALATLDRERLQNILPVLSADAQTRMAADFKRAQTLFNDPNAHAQPALYEARNLMSHSLAREIGVIKSGVEAGSGTPADLTASAATLKAQAAEYDDWLGRSAFGRGAKTIVPAAPWSGDAAAKRIPVRIGDFGPLTYQNDDVLAARLGRERASKIKLLSSSVTPMLSAEDLPELYAYEIVNFVNGARSVGEIRDAVSAEFGPIPIDVVADYLDACAEAKIIAWK